MSNDLTARLALIACSAEVARQRAEAIGERLTRESAHLRAKDFDAIGVADLSRLFREYDGEFFGGLLSDLLEGPRGGPISFRLSNRMTSAAGKTFSLKKPRLQGGPRHEYQIAISTLLLFQTFRDGSGPVEVCGQTCHDRLNALQRVFEHELVHLVEFLTQGDSSCSAPPFQALAWRAFAHAGTRHDLLTPRELAARRHQLKVGDRVTFLHEGRPRVGLLNRITKRATVLVESPEGRNFSDGQRYLVYYVPLGLLQRAESTRRGDLPQ